MKVKRSANFHISYVVSLPIKMIKKEDRYDPYSEDLTDIVNYLKRRINAQGRLCGIR